MIIEFGIENFRSIYDKAVFSMNSARIHELEETLIENKIGKFLPSRVIYGVNASGKTSIIYALMALKQIILDGELDITKPLIRNLPIYHFIHRSDNFFEPTKFSISFLEKGNVFAYEVWIDNIDMDTSLISAITYEKLDIDGINIFERKKDVVKFNTNQYDKIKKHLKNIDKNYLTNSEKVLKNNVGSTSVFTSWFGINNNLNEKIKNWFQNNVKILNNVDDIQLSVPSLKNEDEERNFNILNDFIFKLVKEADFGPQDIKITVDNNNSTYLLSRYKTYDEDQAISEISIPSVQIESLGTMKLIKLIGPFIDALLRGGVLIVDEIDSSIHPNVIAGIIKAFYSKESNPNGAQLIFTTHNPVFLNKNLFRRDEITFIEKDSETLKSTIFTLDDINIRNDENYLKNYLEGKYINFTNIDFTSIIEGLYSHDKES